MDHEILSPQRQGSDPGGRQSGLSHDLSPRRTQNRRRDHRLRQKISDVTGSENGVTVMPSSTTTGISAMHLVMSERTTSTSNTDVIASVMRAARKTDWDDVIVRADRAASIGGAAVLIAALLYFAPIIVNMLSR